MPAYLLLFFLQHSIMVRRFFLNFVARFMPGAYTGAVYSVTSGIFLFGVIVFWQSTAAIFEAPGIIRLLLRAMFIMCVIGFFWAVKSVEIFDPFGVRKITDYLKNKNERQAALAVKGPYRLVRHPLYLFIIIMIWSCPDLTQDRLLFNILWSVWIIIGAIWEEKDLLRQFGDAYRKYQKETPMFLPLKLSKKEKPHSH
ncbi:MAG TPA: isoprenylcysteine carboxylmethyltransferase family protein [Deltaproteobacteria bacterium]|nr:isoprenylcysteine carboxylmethyltransferase family protein [Deltaproteobacteria bacterium]